MGSLKEITAKYANAIFEWIIGSGDKFGKILLLICIGLTIILLSYIIIFFIIDTIKKIIKSLTK